MQGQFCRFYVHENDRHRSQLLWEWLLEQASKLGIRGGSAFKAMAGFGAGLFRDRSEIDRQLGTPRRFEPRLGADERESRYATWLRAVERSRGWAEGEA